MTSLFATNDYRIGLANNPCEPHDPLREQEESCWDEAADRAAEMMTRADAIAEYADDGGSAVHLPAELADLIRLAHAIPAGNLTVRPKILEAIGEAVLRHVEDVLCAREYRVIQQAERFGRDFA